MQSEYEIIPYRPDLMHQVVILMHYLWGGNPDVNLSYLEWKYHHNPYTEAPLGIVTLYKNRVVGYRGYFATKWHIPETGYKFIILVPGDTCVHPDHRQKGLSVAMGNMATMEYASKYPVFLNLSAMKNSLPGYLRMGFVPLLDKTYLLRYNLLRLLRKRYLFPAKRRTEFPKEGGRFEAFDNIVVSKTPRPEVMAALSRQHHGGRRITLFQDEDFFRWRFNNKRSQYIFYYHQENNIITGYLVMRVHPNNYQTGYVIDFRENDNLALKNILRFIIKTKHVDLVSITDSTLNEKFSQILRGLGFKKKGLIQRRKKKIDGVTPFLVKPVQKECVENDWFIEGLDIRKIENWEIKDICSDAG